MKSFEIRKVFLEFFKGKGHKILPSDSLIPSSDPTLLFTSAGMVQFKNYFTGVQKGLKRVATSQRCFRTTDIEKIGYTARHLSFFEMLGNFSFGDYFKEEAIKWAWEFLNNVVKLDRDRLYVTVYKDDNESFKIWREILNEDRIFKLSDETNFWQMGATGPCGPCSEIIYDLGKEVGCQKPDCKPGCDCDRWLEVWNLVFTQFDKKEDGLLLELPQKNIDTGMGLERLSMVVNLKKSVFETDLFQPIISYLSEILPSDSPQSDVSFKLISDHSRAILFLMSDGIIASNEGRGYVLRRIIRRAQLAAKLLGYEKPFLYKVITKVVDIMSGAYPEILPQIDNVTLLLKNEEEKFLETLTSGLKILNEFLESLKNSSSKILSGRDAFYLYETYGFPFDLTREICLQRGFSVDEESFVTARDNAKMISSGSWVGADAKETTIYEEIKNRFGTTEFVGYEDVSVESEVIAIIKDKKNSQDIEEGEEGEVILRKTPFYAQSGGQVGDTGELKVKGEGSKVESEVEVIDTQKPIDDLFVHKVRVKRGKLKTQGKVIASVDENRRKDIARHHTATHLLHRALRELLGKNVVQAGSLVAPDHLRFDFTYPRALQEDEIIAVENSVNTAIMSNMKVCIRNENIDEAKKKGAIALFGEKYSDMVRTVSVGDTHQPYSLELCGGIHVNSTGEIGIFKIISESSIGSGIRRIVALCGYPAHRYIYDLESISKETSNILGVPIRDIPHTLKKVLAWQKDLENEIERLKDLSINEDVSEFAKNYKVIGNIKFVSAVVSGYEEKSLVSFAERLLSKIVSGVVLVVNKREQKFSYVFVVSNDVVERSLTATEIAKIFTQATSSSGGGRDTLARGGGKDLSKILNGIEQVEVFLSKKVL